MQLPSPYLDSLPAPKKWSAEIPKLQSRLDGLWQEMKSSFSTEAERLAFYDEVILPDVIRLFYMRERPKIKKKYDILISTVGTSKEPVILTILALQPKSVVFVCTEDSRQELQAIQRFTGIGAHQFEVQFVDKDDMTSTYEKIRQRVKQVKDEEKVAVDITAGTKAMTAGAAIGAVLSNPDIFYVSSKNEKPKSIPGSERLLQQSNPLTVHQDLELRTASELWLKGFYTSAAAVYQKVHKESPGDLQAALLMALAQAYGEWDLFHFSRACAAMEKALEYIEKFQRYENAFGLWDHRELLQKQVKILEKLAPVNQVENEDKDQAKDKNKAKRNKNQTDQKAGTLWILQDKAMVTGLVFSLWEKVKRDEELGYLDTSALLLYRMTEILSQRRLALYGLDTSKPDYDILPNKDEIWEKFRQLLSKEKLDVPAEWPRKIALTHGYALLLALEDPWPIISIKSLASQLSARNNGFYAHGFRFLTQEDFDNYREPIKALFNNWCKLERISRKNQEGSYRFLKPMDFASID